MPACCRVCLQYVEDVEVLDLSLICDEKAQLNYSQCFTICTKILLNMNDGLPYRLCKSCGIELQMAYDFHKKVEKSKRILAQMQPSPLKFEASTSAAAAAATPAFTYQPTETATATATETATPAATETEQELFVKKELTIIDEFSAEDMEDNTQMEINTFDETDEASVSSAVVKALEPFFRDLTSEIFLLKQEIKGTKDLSNKILPKHPFTSIEDFDKFEEKLNDSKDAFASCENELSYISLKTKTFVTKCWKNIFEDHIAEKFSWEGTAEKRRVRNLNVSIAIRNAAHTKGISEEEFKEQTKAFFQYAKNRQKQRAFYSIKKKEGINVLNKEKSL